MKKTALYLAMVVVSSQAWADAAGDIEQLRAELARQRAQIEQQQQQIEALADVQEKQTDGDSATTVGMYGEVHFNGLEKSDADVGKNNLHAHRVVLLVGHEFAKNLRFFSEVEFEGAEDSTEVEVELEQFLVNWDVSETLHLTMGQFLVPVGILNETHEPETFYGVERNPVETLIIPGTWWEKGVMAGYDVAPGVRADFAVHAGLRGDIASLGTDEGLRGFRQEFGGARAEDLAYTLRMRYTAVSGLELGFTLQRQENITQSNDVLTGGSSPATLSEAHVVYQNGAFGLRALVASWDIDNALAESLGTDALQGAFVEPSWKFSEKVGVFARYNQWNTTVNAAGEDRKQINAGVNYWLHPRVVLKADVQDTNQPASAGDGFNLGLGLSF